MAEISAKQVMALRAKTDLPMMDCKKALVEADGDEAAAIEILRKKMKGKLETKAARETAEGRIGVFVDSDGTTGGIIELLCETTPVAKNDVFIDLCTKIAEVVAKQDSAEPASEAVLSMEHASGSTVSALMEEVFGKLRENMKLTRCRKVTAGHVASYVHHDGKTGVMVGLDAKPTSDSAAKNLTFHIASMKPMAVTRDDIPEDLIEAKRTEAKEMALAEGKPEQIVDKIVMGKVSAFCASQSLMDQEHIHPDEEKKKVKASLKTAGVGAVTDMVLMIVGA